MVFKIRQPETVGDVYSQSFEGLLKLGKFAYSSSIKLYNAVRPKEGYDGKKEKKIREIRRKGLKPLPC